MNRYILIETRSKDIILKFLETKFVSAANDLLSKQNNFSHVAIFFLTTKQYGSMLKTFFRFHNYYDYICLSNDFIIIYKN